MALKLLLVFVEYCESNITLLLQAIDDVDSQQGEFMLVIFFFVIYIRPKTAQ
jgi:hypothetical protein